MKPLIYALLMISGSALASTYTIDPLHTNARFGIDHFNTSTNVGGFYGITGQIEFDATKKTGALDVSIPVNSLHTGSEQFTQHLLSKDLFDAAQYPNMRFVSKKFNYTGKKLKSIDGELTLLGKTHPVRLNAGKFNCYDSPMLKTQVCGGDFSTTIDRSKWVMNYLVDIGMTKMVKIDIQIEAAKQ